MIFSRRQVASSLIALYPAAWKAEYGAEIFDILMRGKLTPGTMADVLKSAVTEHWRTGEPWFVVGLVLLVLNFLSWSICIAFGLGMDVGSTTSSAISTLLLCGVGFLATTRRGAAEGRAGRSAFLVCLLASAGPFLYSLLILAHLIPYTMGDQSSVAGRHFVFVYLAHPDAGGQYGFPVWFLPISLVASLILDLPVAWLLGALGGLLGRGFLLLRERWSKA